MRNDVTGIMTRTCNEPVLGGNPCEGDAEAVSRLLPCMPGALATAHENLITDTEGVCPEP